MPIQVNGETTGYTHPLLNYRGENDPTTIGIEHVIVPFRDAEWVSYIKVDYLGK